MQVVYDSITPLNEKITREINNPNGLMKVLGVELRNVISEHLTKLGKPFSNLVRPYLVADPEVDNTGATVNIEGSGGAIYIHKILGGWVTPKTAKHLAIPLTPQAKKWGSPKENRHNGLRLTIRRDKLFLTEKAKKLRKKFDSNSEVLHYVLKDKVYHQPVDGAEVPESVVYSRLSETAKDYFEYLTRQL